MGSSSSRSSRSNRSSGMYSNYYNSFYNRDRTNRLPGYNYDTDDWYYSYPSWYEYMYGTPRRYPYYWDTEDFRELRRRRRANRRRRRRLPSPDPEPSPPAPPPRIPTPEPEPEPEPRVPTPPTPREPTPPPREPTPPLREPTPPPRVPTPPPEPPALAGDLKVTHINVHIKENAIEHKTNKFEMVHTEGRPVLRRGQPFKCTLTFERPYNIRKNDAKLEFSIGPNPRQANGTKAVIKMKEDKNATFRPDEFGAVLVDQDGDKVTLKIHPPCNMVIGPWNMAVKTFHEEENGNLEVYTRKYHMDLIFLFNPWCKDDEGYVQGEIDDEVYMSRERDLGEYVMNEDGQLFFGSSNNIGVSPWNFGQFDSTNLEAALDLLLRGFDGYVGRDQADPIVVCRKLAAIVNIQDDGGLLVGNWSNDYSGGTSPTAWNGSTEILDEYMRYKQPVKYAQCWVYSAVTTTICRALGIPTRSITNFSSAHDTDGNIDIDNFWANGEYKGEDSIWNFHAWNEVWMTRPDLEHDYFGWQVLDATPQETSINGKYTLGPTPLLAVKKGYCNIPYDVAFVFSEVNGDIIQWEPAPNGGWKKGNVETNSVGLKISTKRPFVDTGTVYDLRWDITDTYKFDEGTQAERDAVAMARRTVAGNLMAGTNPPENKDIEGSIDYNQNVMIGSDFRIKFHLKNKGNHARKIKTATIFVFSESYTGCILEEAFFKKGLDKEFELKPKQEKTLTVTMKEGDYLKHLKPQENYYIQLVGKASVDSLYENDVWRDRENVQKSSVTRFSLPTLTVEGPREAELGQMMTFNLSFKNPINERLTNCEMSFSTHGETRRHEKIPYNVDPGDIFVYQMDIMPKKIEEPARQIVFSFECKELAPIKGDIVVWVTDDKEDPTEFE